MPLSKDKQAGWMRLYRKKKEIREGNYPFKVGRFTDGDVDSDQI